MISYSTVVVPSTFPPSSRPIYLYPVAEVTRKNQNVAWSRLVQGVNEIMIRNPDSRILVHTVSYALTDHLRKAIASSRIISYSNPRERQRALDLYLGTEAAVLFAPSLERGIDLAGDDCRAIIVCKVPFPNLGDAQVKARTYGDRRHGQLWYSVQTVRSLVQMTGRGMRGPDDYCESYILDSMFVNSVWRKSRSLIPNWWAEALVWDRGRLI